MDNCHEEFVNNWLVREVFPKVQKLYLSSSFNINTIDMFSCKIDDIQIYLSDKYLTPYVIDNIFVVKHEQIKSLISKYASESLVVRSNDDL